MGKLQVLKIPSMEKQPRAIMFCYYNSIVGLLGRQRY